MNKPTAKHYGVIGSDSVIRAYPADETDAYIAHLEQRAEAAEANYLNEVDYAKQLKNNYRAIEAKLAELEKQEPGITVFKKADSVSVCMIGADLPDGYSDLFIRPAPAINLAELVPEWSKEQVLEFLSIAFRHAKIGGDFEIEDVQLAAKIINSSILRNMEVKK